MNNLDFKVFTGSAQKLKKLMYAEPRVIQENRLKGIYLYSITVRKEAFLKLFLNYEPWSEWIMRSAYTLALSKSDLKLCRLLMKIRPDYIPEVSPRVIRSKKMLKLWHSKGKVVDKEHLVLAVIYSADSVLSFLVKKGYDISSNNFLYKLYAKVREILDTTGYTAIPINNMERLLQYGCFDEDDIKNIASTCTLYEIKILYRARCNFPDYCTNQHADVIDFLHRKRLCQYSNCGSDCLRCSIVRQKIINEIWQMDRHEYDNTIQWIPRERLEDLIEMIS